MLDTPKLQKRSHLSGKGPFLGMPSATCVQIAEEKGTAEMEKLTVVDREGCHEEGSYRAMWRSPLRWFRMLSEKLHWSFVVGVVLVYGVSQGVGGSLFRIAADYYWKDVQKIQPSQSQIYLGVIHVPWIVKPLWGLLTDTLPIAGYRRRPYFILAGLLGFIAMLVISVSKNLSASLALMMMTFASGGVAIADVTIDACVAQNSKDVPSLAADMQSLCGLSSSIGGLFGFAVSGFLLHLMSSQGVLGLMCIAFVLVFSVGITLKEAQISHFAYGQVLYKLREASGKMVKALKCPNVWRPCLYVYASFALCLNIHEGLFFWYTDANAGPAFSQEAVGFIFSIGSIGSLIGVLLYQNLLKDYPFRTLLFWSQLLYAVSGMLDLILVERINLRFGIPDYLFAVIDVSVFQMVGRIKWMPLLVLSAKLCPSGIEGTFFALLMSIDNFGLLTSSWGGGILLHALKVTRNEFGNLWLCIVIRNVLRLLPLAFLFLVPAADQKSNLLPPDIQMAKESSEAIENENVELVALVNDRR